MENKTGKMKVVQVDISDLKPAEYNPRKMTEKQEADLAESIRKFGLVDPLVVNSYPGRENVVIGGHQRLRIAGKLGLGKVPVVYVSMDETLEKELNLRLNKNTGEWDWELLKGFEAELLGDVGFDSDELDMVFDEDVREDGFDAGEEYGKIEDPKTKRGDLYLLGEHRLLCGDATDRTDMRALFGKEKARMIFTDPPYNVDYRSPGKGLSYDSGKYGGTGGKILNDKMSDKACLEFYSKVLSNLSEFSSDDATIYWWFANKNNWINRQAFEDTGWHMSQIIIWLKNSMTFSRGQDYHRQYEPCMIGWKRKKRHYSNRKIRNLKDVFNLDFDNFSEMFDVWFEKRDSVNDYVHPTQKPVRLAERALKKNSERGDIVADMFGGSGSALVACEQLGRRCYAMELDPKYCDVIVKRYEKFTDRKAEKIRQSRHS